MTQDSGTAGAPPRSFAALFDLLGLDGRLRVVDVGAAPAEPPPYAALLADDRVDLVAFEPDRRQAQRLRDRYGERACVLEQVVGDGSPGLFRETNMGFTASLLEPDNALAAAFNHLAGLSQFTARRPVATCRLDDLPQAGGADFIKLDAQGGEGAILAGAPRTLAQALVIQTEVLFLPLYRDQPLFADLDRTLRDQGFVFHTFRGFGSRAFAPLVVDGDPARGLNQILWADAVYVRDWTALETLPVDRLRRYAALVQGLYGSFDLAQRIVRALDAQGGGEGLAARHLALLNGA
ncbi:MAG: FkbM family methyltransferase [Proteobacteria bacterium]|nr:FkbM family methyltransferase [Pseudomonadota bacterium]